jgi:2-C-methyl-D-erythritol 4-phosphate cytidylyltransferase
VEWTSGPHSAVLHSVQIPLQHEMTSARYFTLVPAAGIGLRMGAAYPKQYLPLAGKPMLQHVLETFAATRTIEHTFVVVDAADDCIKKLLQHDRHLAQRTTALYHGGANRHESVLNGLRAMREQIRDDDWVLVHDAARPGLTTALIDKLVQALHDDPVGGLLAMPIVDTLKLSIKGPDSRASATVPRDGIWAAQTPQMFRYGLLCRALQSTGEFTDEAGAVEALGLQPKLVEGSQRNFKVTLPHDVTLAELYLREIS